jgi:hypothetical protein
MHDAIIQPIAGIVNWRKIFFERHVQVMKLPDSHRNLFASAIPTFYNHHQQKSLPTAITHLVPSAAPLKPFSVDSLR